MAGAGKALLLEDGDLEQPITTRTLSQAERVAIAKCLRAVEDKAAQLQGKGMSKVNFFLGVGNCLFVAWSLGAIPQHFWIVYLLQVCVLFPIRFQHQAAARPKENAYWLDFCWVANFAGLAFLLFIFLDRCGAVQLEDSTRLRMFSATFGVSCGPLLLAAGLLGNALIFHDADNVASVLVHLFPSLVMYTLRWKGPEVRRAWPQFKLDYFESMSCGDIFLWSMALYLTWVVCYLAWLMAHGMRLPQRGYDTLFHHMMRGSVGKVIYRHGRRLGQEAHRAAAMQNRFTRVDALLYMIGHAVLVCTAISASLFSFLHHTCHAAMCISVTAVVIYNGASRYTYYVLQMHSKIVREVVAMP